MDADVKTNLGYLLHHVAFSFDRTSDQILLKRLGIGFSQFKILLALKALGATAQKQIANYLGQTEASISRQLRLLSSRGLILVSTNPGSRRQHLVSLSSKGNRINESAMELLNTYHAPAISHLEPAQQAKLAKYLKVLHHQFCEKWKNGECGSD